LISVFGVYLMPEWLDIIKQLGAAMLIGSSIGIYFELHQKPTGIRTLGLVSLASAVAVLAVAKNTEADASRVIQGVMEADASRVIQGVMTGVGFLGAGVILHLGRGGQVVHGLSTAATIWITASLGVLCGLAAWRLLAVAVVLTGLLLVAGGAIENWLQRPRL
jgi:putative Mg2+ transporter-C (MgtC) family protein